jgi:hypothetical protein
MAKQSINRRKYLYQETDESGNTELDILDNRMLEIQNLSEVDTVTVTASTEGRLDLIAYRTLGAFNLIWLLAEYNNMIDPFDETRIGDEIRIPSLDEYYKYFARNARRV